MMITFGMWRVKKEVMGRNNLEICDMTHFSLLFPTQHSNKQAFPSFSSSLSISTTYLVDRPRQLT